MNDLEQPMISLIVGVPRERIQGERRVALVPEVVAEVQKLGLTVVVESGAGEEASYSDDAFALAGARIESVPGAAYRQVDIVAHVQPPVPEEIHLLPRGP